MQFLKRRGKLKPKAVPSLDADRCRCFACCHHNARAPIQGGSFLRWRRFDTEIKIVDIPPR